ncbi:MAG: 16S rRNA (cytosine(967)-C(5))-methyltransferase RsmB [Clostridiales bacterium]|nr:16S rRNA (cytosine(967)-C(5))-methyltransferase RsmB [Clostridiales bacterium]
MANERELALSVLSDIERNMESENQILKRALDKEKNMEPRQKAFITELTNGCVRHRLLLDCIISQSSTIPVEKIEPLILNILRCAAYQMRFMDKVPARAAVFEAVSIAKARGFAHLSGFVNGVLRGIDRKRESLKLPDEGTPERLSIMYSFPMWMVRYFIEHFGMDAAISICKAGACRPAINICVNTLKTSADALAEILKDEGMQALSVGACGIRISHAHEMAAKKSFLDGLWHVMDESSMMAVDALDPQSGERVLDICAAPGGKTFYCAYKMKNAGSILSQDISEKKLKELKKSASRLGISIIETKAIDARMASGIAEDADRLLIDAPCSGLGVAGRKPGIKYTKTMDDIRSLSELQRQILESTWMRVKKGGILVYSLCTYTSEECEENTDWFLQRFPFRLVFKEKNLPCSDGRDGFFIAKLERI